MPLWISQAQFDALVKDVADLRARLVILEPKQPTIDLMNKKLDQLLKLLGREVIETAGVAANVRDVLRYEGKMSGELEALQAQVAAAAETFASSLALHQANTATLATLREQIAALQEELANNGGVDPAKLVEITATLDAADNDLQAFIAANSTPPTDA